MTVLEGDVICVRHNDGRVEITQAPPLTRISLDLLANADRMSLKVSGNLITFAGEVVYRVTGWDNLSKALMAELAEDRR